MFAKQPQRFEQQVAEVDGVQRLQTRLVGVVERRAAAAGESRRFAGRRMLRVQSPILPAVDEHRQRSRRPALVVQILGLQDLLEQSKLVVGIENGEIRPQPDELGVHAQDFGADRMECAEPRPFPARRR